jgi:transposase-like protein
VATNHGRGPRTVTLDAHAPSRRSLWWLRREALFWRHVKVRTNRYLNNIVEQNHQALKRRCSAMHGLKSIPAATVASAGIERADRIGKRQLRLDQVRSRRRDSMKSARNRALFGT